MNGPRSDPHRQRAGSGLGKATQAGTEAGSGLPTPTIPPLVGYFVAGILFGIVLTKSEAVSWFRIQEMFRLQGFHMYGIFATALAVAIPSMTLIRRGKVRSISGEPIVVPRKVLGRGTRYWAGGLVFGAGWALTGACPGPMFALIGAGVPAMVVALFFALLGHWSYAHLRPRLPH